MNKKLFVIVNRLLSKSQQAVQGGHAIAQFLIDHPSSEWRNNTLVFLRVSDEDELSDLYSRLDTEQKSLFLEPYWDNKLTAIAAYGINIEDQVKDLDMM